MVQAHLDNDSPSRIFQPITLMSLLAAKYQFIKLQISPFFREKKTSGGSFSCYHYLDFSTTPSSSNNQHLLMFQWKYRIHLAHRLLSFCPREEVFSKLLSSGLSDCYIYILCMPKGWNVKMNLKPRLKCLRHPICSSVSCHIPKFDSNLFIIIHPFIAEINSNLYKCKLVCHRYIFWKLNIHFLP